MGQYIKPGLRIVSAATPLSVAGGCTTSAEDLQLLGQIFGIEDWDKAFAVGESCTTQYPIEEYCKFTSVENGVSTVVLGS